MSQPFDHEADYVTWAELRELELREEAYRNRAPTYSEALLAVKESFDALNREFGWEERE